MPTTKRSAQLARIGVASLAAIFLLACQPKPVPKAPKARRPKAKKAAKTTQVKVDCSPTVVEVQPSSVPYPERSITESINLANTAERQLQDAAKAGVAKPDREQLIEEATRGLITALLSDPYNVNATYNLAAAYAQIGRNQCAVNLLERMVLLRKLRSHTAHVEAKLDRLLGQGRFQGRLDPAFKDLRNKPTFRAVVKKFRGSL